MSNKLPKFKEGDVVNVHTRGSVIWQHAVVKGQPAYEAVWDDFRYKLVVPSTPSTEVSAFENNMTGLYVTKPQNDFGDDPRDVPNIAPLSEQRDTLVANGRKWWIKPLAEGALRKMQPVGTVLKTYFPLADRARAAVAWLGNEKHNPGEELHWARGKSDDHLDCAGRHLSESDDWDVTVLPDGRVYAVLHAAQAAWRASALAQLAAEKYGGVVIMELEVPLAGETAQDRR